MLELGVNPTHSSLNCLQRHYPHQFLLHPLQEKGDRKGQDFLQTSPRDYCSVLRSVVDVIFSDFLDFLCICSCSLLLSFSLCFSIFSWAFRAFSRDIFISFSFFLTSARSWDDVIPRAYKGSTRTNWIWKTADLFAYDEENIILCLISWP